MTANNPNHDLREAYREVVINLAGVLSVHDADDALVWAVFRSLDRVFASRLGQGSSAELGSVPAAPRRRPHPAVLELLAALDRHVRRATPPAPRDGAPDARLDDELIRVPGLFRRWEIAEVIEPGTGFHLEEAGTASDGTPLFAVYRRELDDEKEA